MSTVLLVGCGYLGTRVAALLLRRGERVLATTRKPQRAEEFHRLGVEPVLFDVMKPVPLPRADGLVYAVGMDRTQGASMRDVYVGGLQGTIDELAGDPRFIYVSSTSVYGQTGGEWVDEDAPTEPRDEAGQVILTAEATLRYMLPGATILRSAGTYGTGRLIGVAGLRAGTPVKGDPNGWLNLIHIEDAAAAVVAALSRGPAGMTYNVADGHPVQRRDYYTHLAGLIGADPPTFAPTPDPVNRRIDARRMREQLGVVPRFADYRAGLADAYHGSHEHP
jgi:nucleoside-diphosphate-sugar epimerase